MSSATEPSPSRTREAVRLSALHSGARRRRTRNMWQSSNVGEPAAASQRLDGNSKDNSWLMRGLCLGLITALMLSAGSLDAQVINPLCLPSFHSAFLRAAYRALG